MQNITDNRLRIISKKIRGKIKRGELLKHHTTFKIGGPAEFFIEPKDIQDLKLLLNLIKDGLFASESRVEGGEGPIEKISILVIGAGSNILASDKGLDCIVIRLGTSYFKKINSKGTLLSVGSGAMLSQLVRYAQIKGLSGLEFLTGIPGTVGGALAMNAGADKKNIGDLVENITVMDYNSKIRLLSKKNAGFSYRRSKLSRYLVLKAVFRLVKKDKKQIQEKIEHYRKYRKLTQDHAWPSAGCFFKNPQGNSAGRLIDLSGLKGRKVGDAAISQRHANFLINLGQAKAEDVLRLMDIVRKKVADKFGITLEPEVKIWN